MGYHGCRATGHRIVSLEMDEKGHLLSPPREIVGGWSFAASVHPQGSPVSLVEDRDRAILMVEDHAGTLLRLSRE